MTSIAIVIPTLNRAPLLQRSIASALACAPAPDEVVVVDCGSADNTSDVVRSFGSDVELIRRSLPNAASARNMGLAYTRSRYVGFLDSDDEALPGKTGGLAEVLDVASNAVLIHGTMDIISGDGGLLPRVAAQNAQDRARARGIGTSYAALASFCSMYTSATLIRRSSFEDVGGYDESLDAYEDLDLYLRLSLAGELKYADIPACRYRVWGGNVAWDRTAEGIVEVARKHLRMLPSIPVEMRHDAQVGFRTRLAGSLYTLAALPDARREALAAVRLSPRRALLIPEVRRALTRSFLPRSILTRVRSARSAR